MAGSTVLLVAILYAPVPPFVWELTGIGRVLWRVWVVPVAVLLGAVVTAVPLAFGRRSGARCPRCWRAQCSSPGEAPSGTPGR